MAFELVITVGQLGVECVRVPGWSVVTVAILLTAPRLLRERRRDRGEG